MKLLPAYDSPTLASRLVMAACDLLSHALIPLSPIPRLPLRKEQTERLLLLRLDGIGDNVCSWPALKLLREQLPETRISLAVGPWAAPLYRECPWLDEVIEWDSGLFGLFRGKGMGRVTTDICRCKQFRQDRYDAGIDLRGDLLSIALLKLIAPEVRVADVSRGGRRLLTDPLHIRTGHEMQRTYEVACAALGIPARQVEPVQDWPRPLAGERAVRRLNAAGLNVSSPAVAICPLALWPWKQWPKERFKELAGQLKHNLGLQPIWFLEQPEQASEYSSGDPVFCGPLDEVAAAMRICKLAVSNDSGLMHMAIAAGCKTVQLFGPGDAARFAHRGADTPIFQDLNCQYNPCTRSGDCRNLAAGWCLEKISVDEVLASCRQLMAAPASRVQEPGLA